MAHHVDEDSIYTESGESEYTDDYTLEEDDYTDGSSYYDDSEDESYERALSVFSRRGNKQYTGNKNNQRVSPYNIRDNIQNHGRALAQNKNIQNQQRTPQNLSQQEDKILYAGGRRFSKTTQQNQHNRSRSYAAYRTSAKKPLERTSRYSPVKETPAKTSPFQVNNYMNNNENDENRFEETKLKTQNPYLNSQPRQENHQKFVSNLRQFTNQIMSNQEPKRQTQSGTCIFDAVANCAYNNSINSTKPENFNEYMRSARQEYTKALRLLRQLKDNSSENGEPEPYYMSRRYTRSKTLLLDMDETLIHSEEFEEEKYKRGHPQRYDFVIEMHANGRIHKIGVYIRPHCMDFLRKLSQKFEVVIFTAARQDYADKILDKLDPNRTLFAGRMYRQHCTQVDGSYVKDFSVIKNRRKEDCILVDNLVYSFAGDMDRGIHILNFYDDKTDTELKYLGEVLDQMKPFMDVGEFLERNFGFQRFYDYL